MWFLRQTWGVQPHHGTREDLGGDAAGGSGGRASNSLMCDRFEPTRGGASCPAFLLSSSQTHLAPDCKSSATDSETDQSPLVEGASSMFAFRRRRDFKPMRNHTCLAPPNEGGLRAQLHPEWAEAERGPYRGVHTPRSPSDPIAHVINSTVPSSATTPMSTRSARVTCDGGP